MIFFWFLGRGVWYYFFFSSPANPSGLYRRCPPSRWKSYRELSTATSEYSSRTGKGVRGCGGPVGRHPLTAVPPSDSSSLAGGSAPLSGSVYPVPVRRASCSMFLTSWQRSDTCKSCTTDCSPLQPLSTDSTHTGNL